MLTHREMPRSLPSGKAHHSYSHPELERLPHFIYEKLFFFLELTTPRRKHSYLTYLSLRCEASDCFPVSLALSVPVSLTLMSRSRKQTRNRLEPDLFCRPSLPFLRPSTPKRYNQYLSLGFHFFLV